jgi:drug/metabolite transporter (DMT)-like permease
MSARSWALLILLGLLWGGSFFFVRVAVAEIDPLTLVFLRVVLAAGVLWPVVLIARSDLGAYRGHLPAFLLLAVLNNVIPFTLIVAGQTAIGAGLASIINATTPLWTALVARGFGVEARLPAHKLAGIVIGIAGAALMFAPAVAGAAISYGFAATFARRFKKVPPMLVATGQLTASSLLMTPVALVAGNIPAALAASPQTIATVVALAILATAFAYILFFELIASAGASNAALVTLVVPISAVVLGTVLLGERLDAWELAGMAVILVSLVVIDGRLVSRR